MITLHCVCINQILCGITAVITVHNLCCYTYHPTNVYHEWMHNMKFQKTSTVKIHSAIKEAIYGEIIILHMFPMNR